MEEDIVNADSDPHCGELDTKKETVHFTPEMVAVFVEHEKVISKLLKRCHDLTITEFCILRELYLAGGKAEGMDFVDFLMLRRNTVSMAVTSLEKKGYVKKQYNREDRRIVGISVTELGVQVTQESTHNIYEAQLASFWSSLSIEDERGGHEAAVHVLDWLRGSEAYNAAPLSENNTPISPEFIMFVKAVPAQWTHAIKQRANLSLTDYRVLHAIAETNKGVRASDLARSLLLERSLVSNVKDSLVRQGLVSEKADTTDRRNSLLVPTKVGKKLDAELTADLTKLTADLYSLCDEDLIRAVNDWHGRMFNNINILNQLI